MADINDLENNVTRQAEPDSEIADWYNAGKFKAPSKAEGAVPDSEMANWYASQKNQSQLRYSVDQAAEITPDLAARVFKVAAKTGLPQDFIDRNIDDLEKEIRRTDFDADKYAKESPAVAKWFSEHPNNVAVAQDDFDNLSTLERLIKVPQRSITSTLEQMELNEMRYKRLTKQTLSTYEQYRLDNLAASQKEDENFADKGGWWALKQIASGGTQGVATLLEAQEGGVAGAVAGGLASTIGGPITLLGVPVTAASGYLAGVAIDSAASTYRREAGAAHDEFITIRGEDGELIDPMVAEIAAHTVGALNAPVELIGLGLVIRTIPGGRRALSMITRESVKDLLARPSVMAAMKQISKNYSQAATGNALQEAIQESTVVLGGEISKSMTTGDFASPTLGQQAGRVGEAAISGAVMGTGMGTPGAIMHMAQSFEQVKKAKQNEQFFLALGDEIKKSNLLTRMPDKMEEVVERMTENGPIPNVYLPVESANAYFKEKGIDPRAAMKEVLGSTTAYDEALITNSDIEIPTAVYAVKLAPTEHNAALVRELRTEPNQMNVREAEQFVKDEEVALVERHKADRQAQVDEAAAKVGQDVADQLTHIGLTEEAAVFEELLASTFRSVGSQPGVDPAEIYSGYKLKIDRQIPEMLAEAMGSESADTLINRLRDGDMSTEMDVLGDSLTEFLSKSGIDLATTANEEIKSAVLGQDNKTATDLSPGISLFQGDRRTKLSVLHNLTADNLMFADKLGGLAAPSLGVVREDMGIEGYGEITLIGRSDLADPNAVEIHDADSYTTTFPVAEYKSAPRGPAKKLVDEFRPWAEKFDDRGLVHELWNNAVNKPDPWRTISDLLRRNSAKAWFLSEQGIEAQPTMELVGARHSFARMPAWEEFVETADLKADNLAPDDPARIQLSKDAGAAALKAFQQYIDTVFKDNTAEYRATTAKKRAETIVSDDGSIRYGVFHGAIADVGTKGKMRVNSSKTGEKLDKLLTGKEKEFNNWVENKVLPIYGDPFVTVGRKKMPYTLNNIVESMTRGGTKAQQKTLVFGEGKVRAVASKRLKSLEEIRDRAEWQLDQGQNLKEARTKTKEAMEKWRIGVVDFYGDESSNEFSRIFDGYDAAMRAIAKSALSGNLASALRAEGFRGVPDYLIAEGKKTAALFMKAPVPYFEAKPDRAVMLNEFSGAVVPEDVGPDVTNLLDDKGISWKKYGPQSDDKTQTAAVIKLREELAAKGEAVLFQSAKKGGNNRGVIRIGKDRSISITLLENANKTTFIHEVGHFYFELLADLAQKPNAPEQVVNDYKTLLDFVGAKTREEVTTEQHEKIANGFMTYLYEGKAPSIALRKAFARLKSWMMRFYKAITDLDVQLTDDVRGVFDRLLAAQNEIDMASNTMNARPLFDDAQSAGDTEAQFAEYREAFKEANTAAEEDLVRTILKQQQRENAAWWKEEKEKVRKQIESEINTQRDYIALSILQRGVMPDGTPAPEFYRGIKLNKEMIKREYGDFVFKRLPRPYVYSRNRKEGLHPSVAADLFGYKDGAELLAALSDTKPIKEFIEAETDSRMTELFGDMLVDGSIINAATAARHNERRAKLLLSEISKLQRFSKRRVTPMSLLRDQAETIISAKELRDIKPILYQSAEARAAKASYKALAKGDHDTALLEKQRELLNHELYRVASKVVEEASDIQEHMNTFGKLSTRKRIGLAGKGFLDHIDSILDRFDFRKASLKAIDNRAALATWALEQNELGIPIDIDPKILNEAYRQNYKNLTIAELRGINDAVKMVENSAKINNKLLKSARSENFAEAKEEVINSIYHWHPERPTTIDFAPAFRDRVAEKGRLGAAFHTKMEFLFEYLDGTKDIGTAYQYFFQPIAQAEDTELAMQRVAAQKMAEIFNKYERQERATWFFRKVWIPEINSAMTKAKILTVALNWGNAYNRKALMDGYGWSKDQVLAIISHMEEKDCQTVQEIWDYLDTYWPEIEAQELELTGVAPPKVMPLEVDTPFGKLRGGYYPVLFDSKLSWRQAAQDLLAQAQSAAGSLWAGAMPRHGYTNKRTGTGGKPVLLNLTGLSQHLSDVIHDLSHRKALIDVGRLINDKDIRAAIENSAGREMYRQLNPWLVSVATGDRYLANPIEDLLGRARSGATVVNLGWKLTSGIAQTLGYLTTVKELGPKYAAKGLKAAYHNPRNIKKIYQAVADKSEMMKSRPGTYDRDVRASFKKLGLVGEDAGILARIGDLELMPDVIGNRMKVMDSYSEDVRESFFYFISTMDMAVSLPTWLGGYMKAMDGGIENVKAGDEKAAVEYANHLVRITQAAGNAKDLAAIQRGGETWRLFTMFHTSFSTLFNQFEKTAWEFKIERNKGKLISSLLLLWIIPSVLDDLILGRVPDDLEEPEDWLKWIAEQEASYPFQSIVLVRDIVNGMGKYGYDPSAAFDAIDAVTKTLSLPIDLMFGDKDEMTRADIKNLVHTTGYAAGLPTRQVWLTSEYMYDWMVTGEVAPDDPAEAAWGALVAGKPKK